MQSLLCYSVVCATTFKRFLLAELCIHWAVMVVQLVDCFAESRLVSYRSRVALYVVVVSVMAAKHVSSHVIATPFYAVVESSSFDNYTLGHTV